MEKFSQKSVALALETRKLKSNKNYSVLTDYSLPSMEKYQFVKENLEKAVKCYPHLTAVECITYFHASNWKKQLNTPTFNWHR